MGKKKLTYEYVKSRFEERGYKLLSEGYQHKDIPLDIECSKGHITTISWNSFRNGRGCNICSNSTVSMCNCLATTHPEISKLMVIGIGEVNPYNVTYGSQKYVWWKCKNNHPEWRSRVQDVVNGNRCPYCSNQKALEQKSIKITNTELCKEWDFEKNISGPENYTPGSNKKVWWICSICGNRWAASVYNRCRGTGCFRCSRAQVSKISQEWLDSFEVSEREYKIKLNFGKLGFVRVDGFNPETNTVYEFLGDYWHGGNRKDLVGTNQLNNTAFSDLNNRTFQRFEKLKAAGYNIIYIWESDFKEGKKPQTY